MREKLEIRIVPGIEELAVTQNGTVFNAVTLEPLQRYLGGGYWDVFFKGKTHKVHRLVALAWVKNPDPEKYKIVNHIDGNRKNAYYKNLEWTDVRGNNKHAVDTGLRNDPFPSKVRDFYTGIVYEFPSSAQAAVFMGFGVDTHYDRLRPKMFGKLLNGRYEYRSEGDDSPWFYENRKELVKPSRYMVVVTDSKGSKKEVYSTRAMLMEYQLYDSPYGKAIPALAKYAAEKYPDHKFEVFDAYTNNFTREMKRDKSFVKPVVCTKGDQVMEFSSLRKCADYFKVDRKLVKVRLRTGKTHDGWKFEYLDKPGHTSE